MPKIYFVVFRATAQELEDLYNYSHGKTRTFFKTQLDELADLQKIVGACADCGKMHAIYTLQLNAAVVAELCQDVPEEAEVKALVRRLWQEIQTAKVLDEIGEK